MKVGILGAGQLGRMLAMAGARLGVRSALLDPALEPCAADVAPVTRAGFDDLAALDRWLADARPDVVTYEFENVPVQAARHLAERVQVYPPPSALEFCQDRLEEKTLFRELGVATARFARIDSDGDVVGAVAEVGTPAILKTRRMGYDGKGQAAVATPEGAAAAFATVERAPSIIEQRVPFRREVSIIAVRGRDGGTAFYPLTENHHAGGILRVSRAPADGTSAAATAEAHRIAAAAMDRMRYVGVLAIELFEHEGRLLANEMAPRVHNSGHWTIDGAACSQFENHLRAVLGLPLGETTVAGGCCAGMLNLVGGLPDLARVCAVPGARVHLYGKSARPGRKVGHINVLGADAADVDRRLREAAAACGGAGVAPADLPAQLR